MSLIALMSNHHNIIIRFRYSIRDQDMQWDKLNNDFKIGNEVLKFTEWIENRFSGNCVSYSCNSQLITHLFTIIQNTSNITVSNQL